MRSPPIELQQRRATNGKADRAALEPTKGREARHVVHGPDIAGKRLMPPITYLTRLG